MSIAAVQFDRKPRIATADLVRHSLGMDTLTNTPAEELAHADIAWWPAVLARDHGLTAASSTRVHLDRHLLPAVLPEPPSAPRPRPLLRGGRRRARGRVPCLQALQAGHGRARGRSLDRQDPPRLRLSLERRRSSVAGDAGLAGRRQPVSPPAQLQAHRRRLAARVRRRRPSADGQADDCATPATSPAHVRRRLRIEQSLLRARGAEARHGAVIYRRGGAGMQIGYTIVDVAERVARTAAGGGHRRAASAPLRWDRRTPR